MKILKLFFLTWFVLILSCCGGGGGSAGTTSSGSSSPGTSTTTSSPSITLEVQNSSGTTVSTNTISSGDTFYLVATLKSASGTVLPNKLITFTASSSLVSLVPSGGTALTDSSGVAKIQIKPLSLSTTGAGTAGVSAAVGTTSLSASLDFQVSAASVSLINLSFSTSAISAFQSAAVTVQVLIGGVTASSNSTSVSFTASCGTVSPATATVNSSGIATTSYKADAGCSGDVLISAYATSGSSTAATGSINVTAAEPANISFVSASPSTVVISSNPLGVKQSTVKFQVVDASGSGMSGQSVNLSLSDATVLAGVIFKSTGNTTQTAISDSSGYITAIVSSGSLPTPVSVFATLASNSAVQAVSAGLAVTSGRPTQNAASLSADKLSIEAFNTDGVQTNITFRIADRQGNPVPANTPVTFVTEAGLITGSCLLDSSSQCTVVLTSQGTRPADGRVSVLAYLDGEESFDDANGNNSYDVGETFYDMGEVYRDDNEDGSYNTGTVLYNNGNQNYYKGSEQLYPGGTTGSTSCASNSYSYPSVANTCDGAWSANIRVRKQIVIVFATAAARVTSWASYGVFGAQFVVSDNNGSATMSVTGVGTATFNSASTGSSIAASLIIPDSVTSSCAISSGASDKVPNQTGPYLYTVALNGDSTCSGLVLSISVTSPAGVVSTSNFVIP